jgi:hypothetical protein
MLMKPPYALVGIPLSVPLLRSRQGGSLAALWAVPFLCTAATLALQARLYGSPWHGPIRFEPGHPIEGALGLLFSRSHGVAPWAPVLFLAALGWPFLLKERPATGGVLAAALLLFGLFAFWREWEGGWCYGPRLLVPAFPLWGMGLVRTFSLRPLQRLAGRLFSALMLTAGFLINGAAVRWYWLFVHHSALWRNVFAYWAGRPPPG